MPLAVFTAGPLVSIGVYILEALFAVGMIGSALVVLLTSIEDFGEVLSKD